MSCTRLIAVLTAPLALAVSPQSLSTACSAASFCCCCLCLFMWTAAFLLLAAERLHRAKSPATTEVQMPSCVNQIKFLASTVRLDDARNTPHACAVAAVSLYCVALWTTFRSSSIAPVSLLT